MKKIIILIAITIIVGADTLKVSSALSSLNEFAYENPQGKKITIPSNVKTVIVFYGKSTGKFVNEYLSSKKLKYLDEINAVVIADINKMPSIIVTLFALPKMRKYKYPIYLHYTDKFAKYVLAKDEKVTIIKIKDQKVKSISYITTKSELKKVLEN
jgi:hypothetical protein